MARELADLGIVEFVNRTGIPHAMMGMLQALPNTALWHRLDREARLIQDSAAAKGVKDHQSEASQEQVAFASLMRGIHW